VKSPLLGLSTGTWNCVAALALYRVLDLSQQGFGRREWISFSTPYAIFSGEKDGHGIKSWSKNGPDVYKRCTGIACICFTNAFFDIVYIAYLIGIDVHLLLLETNSTVGIARRIQHFAFYFFKYPQYRNMCKITIYVVACQYFVPGTFFEKSFILWI
jgi:hypothetical protein